MDVVAREPCRTSLEHSKSETAVGSTGARFSEGIEETWRLHACQPPLRIAHDFIPAGGKDICRKIVAPTRQHTLTRLQVDIISPVKRFLSMRGDIGSKMALVG